MSSFVKSGSFYPEDTENNPRNYDSLEYPCNNKKLKSDINMTDTANQKRPNFSALTANPNGINKGAAVVNSKPGAAKKLVIKNFKGKSPIKA